MEENQSLLELEVDQEASSNIIEMAKWTKLFGVLVASLIGLFVLFFILASRTIRSGLNNIMEMNDEQAVSATILVFSFILFLFVGISTVILVYLFKGVNGLRAGIRNKDQLAFNMGLANLRNSFAIYTSIMILMLLIQLINLI